LRKLGFYNRSSLVLALAVLLGATVAQAGAIFDTGIGDSTTFRDANFGPGQGIVVGTDTTITQFGFYGNAPSGANVKFMIWDGTNSNLLFSQTDAIGASASTSLILSDPLSFDLAAGSTYYFGFIADNLLNVTFSSPSTPISQNGLTAVDTGNSNYQEFDAPSFAGYAAALISLQLVGETGSSVPEPGSAALLGLGFVGLLGAAWRRKSAAGTR